MEYERKFKIGKPILEVNNISLSFGGVKAITDTSFNVLEHEVRAIIGPVSYTHLTLPTNREV